MRITFSSMIGLLLLAGIYFLGWSIQTHILLTPDVSWLMHAAKKLLAGGNYTNDFFEINPPLILYLYTPVIFLSNIFSINIITALHGYIFLLGTLSLYLCYVLLKKIFFVANTDWIYLFLMAIACAYFILPMEQFGQREHFLILLSLPYLLGIVCQLNSNKLKRSTAILIGLLAAIGFAIKPYFLITFICIECYYTVRIRNLFAWVRTDVITLITTITFYIILVLSIHLDYLFTVIPLAKRLYYVGVRQSWKELAINWPLFTCYLASLFYALQYNRYGDQTLRTVIFIAMLGFLGSYFLQDTTWYFHIYPSFVTAFLLLTLEFMLFSSQKTLTRYNYLSACLMILFACLSITYYQIPLRLLLIFNPINFFSYFGMLFAFLLYIAQSKKNLLSIAMMLFIIIGISASFASLALETPWYSCRFVATVCMLIILFALIASQIKIKKYHAITTATLGTCLFASAFYSLNQTYDMSVSLKDQMHPIVTFLHTFAEKKPVIFFTSKCFYMYPLTDYADAIPVSRIQFLGWVHAVRRKSYLNNNDQDPQLKTDKNFLIEMLVEDLRRAKPEFIIVDTRYKEKFDLHNFDYIKYFSQNAQFQEIWSSYRYFTTLHNSDTYNFIVYKHI